MKIVTKRELSQQTAQVLAQVTDGETILVTEHGVARWRIDAVGPEFDTVARLRSQGQVISAKSNPSPWPGDDAIYTADQIDALYREARGDH